MVRLVFSCGGNLFLFLLTFALVHGQEVPTVLVQPEDNPLRHLRSANPPTPAAATGAAATGAARDIPPQLTQPRRILAAPVSRAAAAEVLPATPPVPPTQATTLPQAAVQAKPTIKEAAAAVTNELITQRVKEIEANKELDETAKTEVLKHLKSAEDWVRTAEEAAAKTRQYLAEQEQAPAAMPSSGNTVISWHSSVCEVSCVSSP